MTAGGYYPARNYASGQRVALLRGRTGLTQAQMAGRLGVSRRSVQKWESGESLPSVARLRELIALLVSAHGFTPGRENAEAADLWRLISASAAQPFPDLDQTWLEDLLATAGAGQQVQLAPVAAQPLTGASSPRPTPVAPLPLVGRETELATISAMLGSADCRLLTLVGPPGVGKTRLALEVAAQATPAFADGVVFVDLAEVTAATQLVPVIGEALQLQFGDSTNPTWLLLNQLRPRRTLLVLDGFERLLTGVEFLRDILEYAPQTKLLVTSRERLNIKAEWLFDVTGLTFPAQEESGAAPKPDAAQLLAYSAVRLFAQRARQAQPALTLTAENLAQIANICRSVEGLPLALELAAAGVRALSLGEIAREISQNLLAPLGAPRDAPLRHRSLRAAFDYSWLLLDEQEQTTFSRLAVFRGGFSASAAAAVSGTTLRELGALADKSLLRHHSPVGEAPKSASRFVMPAPLREYALQKLRARGEAEQLYQAHARYYLGLAEEAAELWRTPQADSAYERLERDYDNMRAVLTWAQEGGDLDLGLRLMATLTLFWRSSVYLGEGRGWLDKLLAAANSRPVALTTRLRALQEAAWLAFDQRDFAHAERLFDRAIALAREVGDPAIERDLFFNAALQARSSGQYNRALALLEEGLTHQSEAANLLLYARALLLREAGDFARSQELLEDCLRHSRAAGDQAGELRSLIGLADIARDRGDSASNRRYSEQALNLPGDQGSRGFTFNNLAQAALLEGDLAGALRLAEESTALLYSPASRAILAETLVTRGVILRAQGAAEGAYAAFSEALDLAWAAGPRLFVVAALEGLALLIAPQQHADEIVRLLGATAAWRASANAPLRPIDRPAVEQTLASARAALGAEQFAARMREASAVPLEQLRDTLPGREVFLASTEHAKLVPSAQARAAATSRQLLDWGDALTVANFYGRTAELDQIQSWLLEGVRVVGILGLGGIGKSALATTMMQRVAPRFDAIIWRSARDAPTVETLIEDYLLSLAPEAPAASSENSWSLLLEQLRRRRVLLVLDNLETLLAEGVSSGQMRPGYEGYNRFLSELATTRHQSCLLFTSREKPGELAVLEGAAAQVRTLRMAPLEDVACARLLLARGITAEQAQFEELSRLYGGNPLALNIVAQTILDLFDGELGPFLAENAVIYGGVRDLLDRQFIRLSPLEQSVMFWLAILREPATLDELVAAHLQAPPRASLLEAIEALRRRSLLEPGRQRGSFTLQSVVLEYVTARLVSEGAREIAAQNLARLIHFGLELAGSPDYVRQTQQRLLVAPMLTELNAGASRAATAEVQLSRLLDMFRGRDELAQGYGPSNLLALLRLAQGNLNGLDLSRLALRNVQLQGVVMRDTSLAGALLRDCTFTASFASLAAVTMSSDSRFCAGVTIMGDLYAWALVGAIWRELWHISSSSDFAATSCAFGSAVEVLFCGTWNGLVNAYRVRDGELLWSTGPDSAIAFTTSIAVAPNTNIVASSHDDGMIQLRDGQSGAQLHSLEHPGPAPALAWSPDGRILAASDVTGAVHLWAWQQDGAPIRSYKLHEHSAIVTGLAFAPDSARLASCGWDGKVRLWNVADGSVEREIDGRAEKVSRVAWSADGDKLAFGGLDATIWLWDIVADCVQVALAGHTGAIRGLAFTADNRALFSGSYDGTIRMWNVANGKLLHMKQSYAITRTFFEWSPDSAWVAMAGAEPRITIHPLDNRRLPVVLERSGENTFGMAWSPDGSRLAVLGQSPTTIELWDPWAGKLVQTLAVPTTNGNYMNPPLAWSPDGQWLAGGSATLGLLLFEPLSGSLLRPVEPFPTPLTGAAWSRDGRMVSSGDPDGVVYCWDAGSGTLVRRLEGNPGHVQSLTWHPAGDLLAVSAESLSSGEMGVVVWDVRRGERVYTMPSGLSDNPATWGAGPSFMVSGKSGGLICWDIWSGELIWQTPPSAPGWQWLARSPDGNKIASSRDDGAVKIWDSRSGILLQTLRPDRPYERLNISGIRGLNEVQKANLFTLGAFETELPVDGAD